MTSPQGDVALLNHQVAQMLLASTIPARLAYDWRDGTPRVVSLGFQWNGEEVVLGTPHDAPKMKVLKDGVQVALTFDSDTMPHQVLMIRGPIRVDTVEGIAPGYAAMSRRVFGEEGGNAWLEQLRPISPRMSLIFSKPI